jgi:hypothetical protein
MIAIESRKKIRKPSKFNFRFNNAAFGGRQARWAYPSGFGGHA